MKIKTFKYFYPEKPILIHIDQDVFEKMSNDPKYIAEPKYNGARCEVHLLNGEVEFWDRHGKKLDFNSNPLYKEGREKIKEVLISRFGTIGYFQFDGELRHNKVTGIQCKLILWDNFVNVNELLNKIPYWARRDNIINKTISGGVNAGDTRSLSGDDTVIVIMQFKDNFRQAYEDCISGKYGDPDEFEGLVIKNVNGMLNLGRRDGINSNWMYKVRKQTGRHRF